MNRLDHADGFLSLSVCVLRFKVMKTEHVRGSIQKSNISVAEGSCPPVRGQQNKIIQTEVDPVTENKDSGFKRWGVSQTALRFRLICTHNLRGRAGGSKTAREKTFLQSVQWFWILCFGPFYELFLQQQLNLKDDFPDQFLQLPQFAVHGELCLPF